MPLPGPKPDKYENVDHQNFSTVDKMSRAEMIEMSNLAYQRGDTDSRAQWQSFAMEHARAEELTASAERMKSMMAPKYVGVPGQIMEPDASTPWDGDPEYKALKLTHAEAKAAMNAPDAGLNLVALRNAEADAADAVTQKREQIKAELAASGAFTEMDQRTLDAQASLGEKAAQLDGMFQ